MIATISELNNYRYLVLLLIKRDLKVRYFNTILGPLWILFRPLVSTGVVSMVVSILSQAKPTAESVVWCYAGILGWSFIANIVTNVSTTFHSNSALTSKVWFPRIILPIVATVNAMIDTAVNIAFLLVLCLMMGVQLSGGLWLFIPAMAIGLMFGFGLGMIFACAAICMRDIVHAISFFIQLGVFFVPIVYGINMVPDRWMPLYVLNPSVAAVELSRSAVLTGNPIPDGLYTSAIIALLLSIIGVIAFRRIEQIIADFY